MKKYLFILLILFAVNANAATHYVSPTGSATWANSTDIAQPCSLATANTNADDDDVVYLRAGDYSTAIIPTNSGSAGHVITYQNYTGETPNITGSGLVAIQIIGKDYIKISGINVTNVCRMFWIGSGADHNEITGATFDTALADNGACPNTTYRAGLITRYNGSFTLGDPSTHNWIHNNTFTKYGIIYSCNDKGTISIGSVAADTDNNNNTIEDNHFSYGGHDNLEVNSQYSVIRNNTFHNEEAYYADPTGCTNSPTSGYFGNRNVLTQTYSSRCLFEGNRLGHAGTPPDDDGSFGFEISSPNNIIRYNYVFGVGGAGIYYKSDAVDNNRIYNNTVYSCGYGDADIATMWKGCHAQMTNGSAGNVFKNNLCRSNSTDYAYGGVPTRLTNDTFENNWLNANGDPSFTNPSMTDKTSTALPDLTLTSESSANDGGTYLTTVHADDTGTGTSLILTDSTYFQAGSAASTTPMGSSLSSIAGDYIKVGATLAAADEVQITDINYTTNTLTVASFTREDGDYVWLSKKSDSDVVLYGNAPDYGAHEYVASDTPPSQTVTVSTVGTGCTASHNGEYTIFTGDTLNVSYTVTNNYNTPAWSGDCPATGTTTRVCTPTGTQTVILTCGSKIAADNKVGTGTPGHKVGAGNPAHKRY